MVKKLLLACLAFSLVIAFSGLVLAFTGCEIFEKNPENPDDTTDPWIPTASYLINSTPTGATIYIREGLNAPDSATGKVTNCLIEDLNPGSTYLIKLRLPGYHDWEAPISPEGEYEAYPNQRLDARLIEEDGGNIEVEAYSTLTLNGWGVQYTYKFSVDVILNSFTFKWPDYDPCFCKEFGFMYADVEYTTGEYGTDTDGDGTPAEPNEDDRVPTGTHLLLIAGYDYYSEQDFCFELEVPCYPGQ